VLQRIETINEISDLIVMLAVMFLSVVDFRSVRSATKSIRVEHFTGKFVSSVKVNSHFNFSGSSVCLTVKVNSHFVVR
jgi:hypothetical protein